MQYRKRMIRSIANRLGAIVAGNGALYGVESRLRPACEALVLEVAGARIEFRDHLPVAMLGDGTAIAGEGDHPAAEAAIGTSLTLWERGGSPPLEIARALPLSAGAGDMVRRMGGDVDRLCALAYVLGVAAIERNGATLSIRSSGHRLHASYHRGALRWEDGVASIRCKPLPLSLRMALAGRPVSAIVDDEVVGGRTIARVVDADPREQVVRVHTLDAGRFV